MPGPIARVSPSGRSTGRGVAPPAKGTLALFGPVAEGPVADFGHVFEVFHDVGVVPFELLFAPGLEVAGAAGESFGVVDGVHDEVVAGGAVADGHVERRGRGAFFDE